MLRSALVYGGAQGIWVDKKKTTDALTTDGHGVTVSMLHTGRHYPDDLSEGGLSTIIPRRAEHPVGTPERFRLRRMLRRSHYYFRDSAGDSQHG